MATMTNAMTQAYRTTCVPKENRIDTVIPNEYVGREIEIIVIPLAGESRKIDLTPIEFDYIDYEEKRLRFKKRLVLTPELDDYGQIYTVSYPEFELETFAYTRQEITDSIKSDIVFLWNGYAKVADEKLTKDALKLKQRLLSGIEEVANA
jgi:hypothetical protein